MRASVAVVFGVALLPVTSQSLRANPSGGVVVSGAASINPGANALTITQTSPTAIINWNNFSIGQGQSTIFQFDGAAGSHSAVLNEVSSGNPSIISGLLESTVGAGGPVGGTVLVLNPSGILFSSTAQINVGNLIASTLNLTDDNQFLKNTTLHLAGDSTASVQNQGNLNALGDIYLIANTVQNSGTLTAGGHVGLAAGTQVTLMQTGAERLTVTTGSTAPIGVENTATGQINATVAELTAAGGNIYALAINNGGAIRANTITQEGGGIYLRGNGGAVVNSGTLSASGTATGTKGGLIEVTGGNITLASGSTVDVSGQGGGGTAYIGGGSHGSDPSIPDAQQTTVESGATINASGVADGNGGKAVVWSSDTSFNGSISAQGGAAGGNGGSVEVSGHTLAFNGTVDAQAPKGKGGSLLLDPDNLIIDNGETVGDSGTTVGSTISPLGQPSEVSWNTIITALNTVGNGGTVTVTTIPTVQNSDSGSANITVIDPSSSASIPLTLSASLVIQAGNTLAINPGANITTMGAGNPIANLTLESTGNIYINANLQAMSSVMIHSGYIASTASGPFGGGQGNIRWQTGGLSVTAPSQTFIAGAGVLNNGTPEGPGAYADLNGQQGTTDSSAQFIGANGGLPSSFTFEQEATIPDSAIPAISQFGPVTPVTTTLSGMSYTIQSDQNGINLATGGNVLGSALTLNAYGSITFGGNLTLASLSANSGIVNPNYTPTTQTAADISWSGAYGVTAPVQSYQAGTSLAVGTGDTVVFNGNGTSTFSPTLDGAPLAPPTTFSVTQDASITDGPGGNLPLPTQFGNGLPQNYTLMSTGGNLTLISAASISGTGTSSLTLGTGLSSGLVSVTGPLQATTLTLQGSGNVGTSLNNLTTLAGTVTLNENQPLTGGTYVTDTSGSVVSVNGSTGSGSLYLTATVAGITDGGTALSVGGSSSFAAGAGNPISFGALGDSFAGPVSVTTTGSGGVTVNNGSQLLTISGAVGGDLIATGAGISDGGATLTVGGTSSLTAGSGNAINFGTTGDSFAGAVTIVSGDNVTLNDAVKLTLNGPVTGNLNATGAGITDGGTTLTVGGTSLLSAGANSITMTANGDDFAGAVTVGNSGNNAVDINNGTHALTINGTVGGDLIATGAGISDGGATLTVGGTSSLTAGSGNAINFGTTGDSFAGAVTIVSGDNVTLNDAVKLTLNGPVTGNLNATGAGITDGGTTLTVGGTSLLSAGANSITMTANGDDFAGAVTVGNSGNNAVDINNGTHALTINGTVGGNLIATGAGLSDGGAALTVGGTSSLTAGSGNAINFGTTGDSFAGAVTIVSGANVALSGSSALAVNGTVTGTLTATGAGITDGGAALTVKGTGASSLTATGGDSITLSPGDTFAGPVFVSTTGSGGVTVNNGSQLLTISGAVGGNLNASGAGLSDGGTALKVGGSSSLTAGAGNAINFGTTGDSFAGAVTIISGANVTLSDSSALAVNGTVNGTLTATGAGITDGGAALTVKGTGASSLTATGGDSITLSSGDTIAGPVSVSTTGSGGVTINNGSQLLTISGAVGGNLTASGAGLSDGGAALTVGGTSSLTAGSGNGIDFGTTGDSFGQAVTINSGDNVTISDSGALAVNGTVTGTLTATGAGITDGGAALTVKGTGTSSLTATGGDSITLSPGDTFAGAVSVSTTGSGGVTINNGSQLLTINGAVGGNLTATGAGLTDGGTALKVGGTSALNAGANPITMTASGDDFAGAVTVNNSGNNAVSFNTGDNSLDINGTIGGNLTTTAGATTLGPATFGGAVNVTANSGAAITLAGAVNTTGGQTYKGDVIMSPGSSISSGGDLSITGPATLDGSVTTSGAQTYSGAVTLKGDSTLKSTGQNVIFDSTIDGGRSLTVNASTSITLNAPVGQAAAVNTLTLTAPVLDMNGQSVRTSGEQTYNGPIHLGANLNLSAPVPAIYNPSDVTGSPPYGITFDNTSLSAIASLTAEVFGSLQRIERQHNPGTNSVAASVGEFPPTLVNAASSYPEPRAYPEMHPEVR